MRFSTVTNEHSVCVTEETDSVFKIVVLSFGSGSGGNFRTCCSLAAFSVVQQGREREGRLLHMGYRTCSVYFLHCHYYWSRPSRPSLTITFLSGYKTRLLQLIEILTHTVLIFHICNFIFMALLENKTTRLLGLAETQTNHVYIGTPPCGHSRLLHVSFNVTSKTWCWQADICVLLSCRLWMWLAWGPSARQCCARRPALCRQPSATSMRWRSPSFRGTRLRWMQMKTRRMRTALPTRHCSTLHPPAWAFAGTPHAITALRSRPTWLTSESASPLLSVPSPNTSSSTCSLTPATGWCLLVRTPRFQLCYTTLHLSTSTRSYSSC